MDLIRTRHFKEYVENKMVYCFTTRKGFTEQQARNTFKDTFYDDFAILSFVIAGSYPNTVRDGDEYLFITDEMEHTDIATNQKGLVGRMTLKIVKDIGKITFSDKSFMHGHIKSADGTVTCYGDYRHFADNVCEIGFSGALMDAYNFARVSKYHTHWGNVKIYA